MSIKLPILCYHKVGPVKEEGRFLNIEPSLLREHVRFFARRRRFILSHDLLAGWPGNGVWLTFDDAYASAVTHALPVLREFSARATFYAVSGLVGQTSSWDPEIARPLAGWDDLLDAQSAGNEVGNHSASHPRFAELSLRDQVREIESADSQLRAHGLQPSSFCFPYGSMSPESQLALQQSGYAVGVALGKGRAVASDPLLALPRIVVAYSDKLPKLLYKLYVRPLLP